MNEVFLCLGGNLGDRLANLEKARSLILTNCGRIEAVSGIYETEAWGSDSLLQYLNQVVKISTALSATTLMQKLLEIEIKLGRKRTEKKNTDRTIDIDILFFNREVIVKPDLVIPHPLLQERKFVLIPLSDIAPGMKHPVFEQKITQLLKKCNDPLKVTRYRQRKYICIEGNIGSGKTTLAVALSKHLKAALLPEQFEKNDLLPLFYRQPDTFAFPLEYSFLLSRYQQITDMFKLDHDIIVADYSIYKCLWFAKANLDKKDFLFFETHFKAIEQQLPKPDLIVYLETTTTNLEKNIKKRGRDYEQNLSSVYLEKVSEHYAAGLQEIKTKKLVVNISSYDKGLNDRLIKTIKKELN